MKARAMISPSLPRATNFFTDSSAMSWRNSSSVNHWRAGERVTSGAKAARYTCKNSSTIGSGTDSMMSTRPRGARGAVVGVATCKDMAKLQEKGRLGRPLRKAGAGYCASLSSDRLCEPAGGSTYDVRFLQKMTICEIVPLDHDAPTWCGWC